MKEIPMPELTMYFHMVAIFAKVREGLQGHDYVIEIINELTHIAALPLNEQRNELVKLQEEVMDGTASSLYAGVLIQRELDASIKQKPSP